MALSFIADQQIIDQELNNFSNFLESCTLRSAKEQTDCSSFSSSPAGKKQNNFQETTQSMVLENSGKLVTWQKIFHASG